MILIPADLLLATWAMAAAVGACVTATAYLVSYAVSKRFHGQGKI